MERVKKRFSRYIIVCSITGLISFVIALVLLHAGFSSFVSLAVSVIISGFLGYAALELWAFPQRTGRLSWRRLLQNAFIGVIGFGVRYAVLEIGLAYFHFIAPFDKGVPLALSYIASFLIGYLLRCCFVFRKDASIRMSMRNSANC